MVRLFALLVVAALTGCDGVSASRFDAVISLHEGRMDGLGDRIREATAAIDHMRLQRFNDQKCSDATLAPGGLLPLGASGVMVSFKGMPQPDGSMDALVVNALGIDLQSVSIQSGEASVRIEDLPAGKARKVKIFVPVGVEGAKVCAEDLVFSYTMAH
jgi:hypothetical protein